MNERIAKHVDGLFESAPRSRRALELKDELISNLNDRYNDLIAEGKDDNSAYSTAIAGIGDIGELIRGLREQEVLDPVQAQMQRQKSALLISASVAIYIISFIPPYVLGNMTNNRAVEVLGNVMMLICWAAATMMLVYNATSKPRYEKSEDTIVENFKEFTSEKRRSEEARKSVISLIPMLVTIIYLILGFGFSLWHPGWIIFLLVPVLIQIVRLIGIYRSDD